MPIENSDNWFLRKHDNGEVFGPLQFQRIYEWAHSAQVNPQDMLSNDNQVWTKAPMVPEMQMDWLVEVGQELLYGPTTSKTLMEFVRNGEVAPDTKIINCCTGEAMRLDKAPFYFVEEVKREEQQPMRGGLKMNLQLRVRELESALIEKRRQLALAQETIVKMEGRIQELEERIKDFGGFHKA